MKTEENSDAIWATNELSQLTHDECLPDIGNCQISSILSPLEPSDKGLQNSLEIPQSMKLIDVQNNDYKVQQPIATNNFVVVKSNSSHNLQNMENNLDENQTKKIKKFKSKENGNNTYIFCDICPFLCTKESRLTEHIQNAHKNGNTLNLSKLKCPGCTNVFYHKISLRSHLIYDHMASNTDLSKIILSLSNSKRKHTSKTSDLINCKSEFELKYTDKLSKITNESFLNDDIQSSCEINVVTNDPISESADASVNNSEHNRNPEHIPLSIVVNLPTVDITQIDTEKMFNNCVKKQNSLSKFLENKKLHKCTMAMCKVRLQNLEKLNYHIKCHHDTNFKCPECKDIFAFWKPLTGHLWRLHKIDMELYSCDKCDYKTFSLGKLNSVHKLIHGNTKSFICDICPKAFKNAKQLRNHKTAHKEKSDTASYFCEICTKVFSDKRQLRIHTDGVHRKIKPFLCNFCGYKGATRSALRMHMRQHTGEKPFACDYCTYVTADHNSLRRHKLRHTGEKPYKCTHCDYACIQSSTYKVHLKTKHPGLEKDLLFSCPDCSFRSINKDIFHTHITTVHK